MATIHYHENTSSTPQQFVAGITDFGPGRSKLFGNSADEYLEVHDQGATEADVTEGSGGIWERLHYDWSDPNRVLMTTTDSNLWGGRSGHIYTFTRRPTERPMWTPSWYARARPSKGGCSASCSGPSATAFWTRHLETRSRPSKPGTGKRSRAAFKSGRPDFSVVRQ
jgi:hypothetical protein